MEEQILKILESELKLIGYNEHGNPIFTGNKYKAREITQHITGFIEWKDDPDNVGYDDGVYHIYEEARFMGHSLQSTYNYYIKNVLNKAK